MNIFFINCPIGFESYLIQEINSFWFQLLDLDGLPTRFDLPEFFIEKGGVEFKTPLHLGLQINFFTKIGLRVLLRIESFQARYFDQFEKKVALIKWSQYFEVPTYRIQLESSKSRLFHESNLKESFSKILGQQKIIFNEESLNTIFIRIFKDQVTVSLDTSGEHLHFRGYRKQQGEAPLRENLASLILQIADIKNKNRYLFLDPYCGSGTLFFENELLGYPNFERPYAFLKFKNTPSLFKSETWKKNYRWVKKESVIEYQGFEKNSETCQKLKNNKDEFSKLFFNFQLNVKNQDSEKIDWSIFSDHSDPQPVVVVTNPPYGERSVTGEVVKNIERMENISQIEKIVIIHPRQWVFNFKKLNLLSKIPLSNQGLDTVVSVFSKPKIVQK